MKYLLLVLILVVSIQAQKPCAEYSYNEQECIGSQGSSCLWNEIQNSCEESSSDQIGCNYNLNEMACLSQILYPDQSFAYCRFSGYCRQLSSDIQGCSKDFSVPACYSVSNQDCIFQGYCQTTTTSRLTNLTNYQNYNQTILSNVDVFVCQNIKNYPVIHSYGKQQLIEGLIESYRQTNVTLVRKYQQIQTFLGCFQPDELILSQLLCSDSGVNIRTCTIITTTGQLCQFINGKCNNVKDSSILNCQDNLNIWACLSVTKITQPCYWNDSQKTCLKYQMTPVNIVGITYRNSPSFCQANTSSKINSDESVFQYECFYDSQKFRCNQMCRGEALVFTKKICQQSVYGCSFLKNTCIFKNKTSQCLIPGQNQSSCMNANEPCQFVNGFCKPLASSDTSNLQCQQGLNKFACINVTNRSQTCRFENNKCNFIKPDDIGGFDDDIDPNSPQPAITNVNPNVCRKLFATIRYYSSGDCVYSANPPCTALGLNKVGCLKTAYTISPCIWSSQRGLCLNLDITSQTQCASLLQVNPQSCQQVTAAGQLCGYFAPNCGLLSITSTPDLSCDFPGLNKLACISITKYACRWYQNKCNLITTEISQGVMCNGLESVNQKTCIYAVTGGETCYFESQGSRCSADVTPVMPCDKPGLNKYGCSFLTADCHFNISEYKCQATIASDLSGIHGINCTTNFPSKSVCTKITTEGVQCQWNSFKNICNPPKYPSNQSCLDITDVNQNACLGFTTVQQVDPTLHYCQYDSSSKGCSLFKLSENTLTDCTYTQQYINVYPCVVITGTKCYFDQAKLLCTKLSDTTSVDNVAILNKIFCLQANFDLCNYVTTPGQKCAWNSYQKICEFQDQQSICDTDSTIVNANYCETTDDTKECSYDSGSKKCQEGTNTSITNCEGLNLKACITSTAGACYYDQRLRDCQSVTLPNNLECSFQLNENGCNMAIGGPSNSKGCQWIPAGPTGKCQLSDEKDFKLSCDKYEGVIACASTTTSICYFRLTDYKCFDTLAQAPVCLIGQNNQVCNQQLCNYIDGSSLCVKSICQSQNLDADCMAVTTESCTFTYDTGDFGTGKCTGSIQSASCSYSDITKIYNLQTCLSANTCYAIPFKNSDGKIVGNKCQTTQSSICQNVSGNGNSEQCQQVKNDCLWNDTKFLCYQRPVTNIPKKCDNYFTQSGCLNTKLKFYASNYEFQGCQWSDVLGCKEFIEQYNCEKGLQISQSACYITTDSIKNCYYNQDISDCDQFDTTATTCTQAKNQYQCLTVVANCWWDPDNLVCSLLTSVSQAASKTCSQLFYSNKDLCLASNIEGEMCQFADICVYSDPLNSKCTDQLNKIACAGVAVLGETCAFTTKCGVADLNNALCTDSVNIYGCMGIVTDKQYCIWLGRQCAPFTNDGITQDSQSLINALVCTRAYTINGLPVPKLPALGVKYSSDTFGCQPSDPSVDTCTTPGMNYYACLNSQVGSCTWDKINKKCTNFVDPGTYTTCEQYLNSVNKLLNRVQNAKSTQDGCSTMTSQSQCKQNLNKLGCLSQTLQPCQWLNNSCVLQDVLFGVVACVPTIAGQPYLNPLSSPLSCSNVNYNSQICYYDPIKLGCVTQFDPLVFTCNTPGLNLEGCIQIKNQSCQFQNGYCLKLEQLGPTDCRLLTNVSQLTCAQLVNGQQTCKASVFQGICLTVGLTDLCSTTGMNQSGCGSLPQCLWNPDTSKCLCAQFNQSLRFCSGFANGVCQQNQSCVFKSNICKLQTCEDLATCTGTVNGYTCFMDINSQCKSAQTCYDISNVSDCTQYTINGGKCQKYLNGYCQTSQCSHITSDLQCNGKCRWDGSCSNQQCQFLSQQQCYGTYLNLGCGWFQQSCYGYQYCEQISILQDTQDNLQKLCNFVIIGAIQCKWQKTLIGTSNECSSNQCRLFGTSKILCQGQEVGNQVCILDKVQKCISCEMILDDCQCAQYVGYCVFQNGLCKSLQCNSFQTSDTCGQLPDKCLWNTTTSQCIMACQRYNETDCTYLSDSSKLCYYDQITQQCLSGQPVLNSVNTIAPQLIYDTTYAIMISLYIIF
ncbi:hypothetical protein pb186bvf_004544 [Paramecium bursaria]